jgi:NTF2 fold immunity protein
MRIAVRFFALLLLTGTCFAQAPRPAKGYVPDEKTAIKIAEAVLGPIYGEKQIEGERPFHAILNENIWTISGSLPEGYEGGVAVIRIDKRTGTILGYIHGK